MDESVAWLSAASIDELRGAIAQVVPDLAGRRLVLNDRVVTDDPRYFQGSAVVDDAFVVKFAWSEPPARRIVHEGRVLAALADVPGLVVPRLMATATHPALVVTGLVSGEPFSWEAANEISGEKRERLVRDLAGFLAVLHDPASLARVQRAGTALDMPEPQATTAELRARFGKLVKPPQRALVSTWCDWVDGVLVDPADRVFLHGDLHGYNLVWDPVTGGLQLVADFESAGVGDPAFDFRYLPGQADTVDLFLEVRAFYEDLGGRELDLRRVMAWHIRTVLGDALWRSEAAVPLPGSGGTASSWVDELEVRLRTLLDTY